MIELRLRGKTFENTLYKVHLKDENQNVISTYSAVPRQAQFNPGQVILGGVLISMYVCFNHHSSCIVSGLPVSVNFLRYSSGTKIRIPFGENSLSC